MTPEENCPIYASTQDRDRLLILPGTPGASFPQGRG